ncbi:hypothetical protein, partial [Barnesiella intestinihominis]|uniref:hypothetical protein n=1 Tax=Barnesiella intestinihominis TaxID=487174 RepID=UPI002307D916
MKEGKADVGFVVDPDVDRLAIVCENGVFNMISDFPFVLFQVLQEFFILYLIVEMYRHGFLEGLFRISYAVPGYG